MRRRALLVVALLGALGLTIATALIAPRRLRERRLLAVLEDRSTVPCSFDCITWDVSDVFLVRRTSSGYSLEECWVGDPTKALDREVQPLVKEKLERTKADRLIVFFRVGYGDVSGDASWGNVVVPDEVVFADRSRGTEATVKARVLHVEAVRRVSAEVEGSVACLEALYDAGFERARDLALRELARCGVAALPFFERLFADDRPLHAEVMKRFAEYRDPEKVPLLERYVAREVERLRSDALVAPGWGLGDAGRQRADRVRAVTIAIERLGHEPEWRLLSADRAVLAALPPSGDRELDDAIAAIVSAR